MLVQTASYFTTIRGKLVTLGKEPSLFYDMVLEVKTGIITRRTKYLF